MALGRVVLELRTAGLDTQRCSESSLEEGIQNGPGRVVAQAATTWISQMYSSFLGNPLFCLVNLHCLIFFVLGTPLWTLAKRNQAFPPPTLAHYSHMKIYSSHMISATPVVTPHSSYKSEK